MVVASAGMPALIPIIDAGLQPLVLIQNLATSVNFIPARSHGVDLSIEF